MFEVGQDVDVRIDISTGAVWCRGTIIGTDVNSSYIVQLRWDYAGDVSGMIPVSELVMTADDIAFNALLRQKEQQYLDKILEKHTEPDAGKRFVCVGVEPFKNHWGEQRVRLRMREENGMHMWVRSCAFADANFTIVE